MDDTEFTETELLSLALKELEWLEKIAKHAITEQQSEWDADVELESVRNVISLLRGSLAELRTYNICLVRVIRAHGDIPKVLHPVAKVMVQQTGGNAGIAWHAVSLDPTVSLPLMPDGAILYAE
jgi:hypothetical protein